MRSPAGYGFNSSSVVISVKWSLGSHLDLLWLDVQHCCICVDVHASSMLFSILLYHYIVRVFKVCPLSDMWHVPLTSPSPSIIPVLCLLLYFEFFRHRF